MIKRVEIVQLNQQYLLLQNTDDLFRKLVNQTNTRWNHNCVY